MLNGHDVAGVVQNLRASSAAGRCAEYPMVQGAILLNGTYQENVNEHYPG